MDHRKSLRDFKEWNLAMVKAIGLSLLFSAAIFAACEKENIEPEPPKPPKPPVVVVKPDTTNVNINTLADFNTFYAAYPQTQPDTIRHVYRLLVARNLLVASDGNGKIKQSDANSIKSMGELSTSWRGDKIWDGGINFGGKATDAKNPFGIYSTDSIHLTPADWDNMKKVAIASDASNFYANAEDVSKFNPFGSILKIIQTGSGEYSVPNAKAVVDNANAMKGQIASGQKPIVDLVGDLGSNNSYAETLEWFVQEIKDGKIEKKGSLRFYAESDSVRHNLTFLENLAATNGLVVQKDGYMFIPNIGASNLTLLNKILDNNAKVRTDRGENLENLNRIIPNNNVINKEITDFSTKVTQIPVWKNGTKTIFTIKDGARADKLTETAAWRIGQKAVNGTPAYPNPPIILKDENGNITDMAYREFTGLTQMDDSTKYGMINRAQGVQELGERQVIARFAQGANMELQYYSDDKHTVSFVKDQLVADGTAGSEKKTLVHLQSVMLRPAVIGPMKPDGDLGEFLLNFGNYCFVIPDKYMFVGEYTMTWWGNTVLSMQEGGQLKCRNYPNWGAGNTMYYMSETDFKKSGKKARMVPFAGWEDYMYRLQH